LQDRLAVRLEIVIDVPTMRAALEQDSNRYTDKV
jgi:hypothetical protein